jgi:hypothetical protein
MRIECPNLLIAFRGGFGHTRFVIKSPHSKSVRRISAACLAVWVLSFLACSLHCTLGNLHFKASANAHSCCAEQPRETGASHSTVPTGSCHTFRDLTVADSGQVRVDLAPQWVAVVTPFLVSWISVPANVEATRFVPEPDIGPPSPVPLIRLAGRAPPALV